MKRYSFYLLLAVSCLACNSQETADTTTTPATSAAAQGTTTTPKPVSTPDSLYEIVPGERIGRTYIGQPVAEATKDLGRPDAGDAAMGKAWGTWNGDGADSLQHQLSIYSVTNFDGGPEISRVQQVRITSPSFATRSGVETGKLLSEVRQSFPALKAVGYYPGQQQRVYIYDSPREGIAFDVALPDSTVTAITVHKPGEQAPTPYVGLHQGMVLLNAAQ